MANTKKTKSSAAKQNTAVRPIKSVILFAFAVFLLFLVFLKGQNVWTYMHNFVFGIFGVTAYICPFVLGLFVFAYAKNNKGAVNYAQTIEIGIFVLLLNALISVFATPFESIDGVNFLTQLGDGYTTGVAHKSGGLIGALFGNPLYLAFGKAGAVITYIILLIVLLMIITKTTLGAVYNAMSKPVKAVSAKAENAHKERMERNAEDSKRVGNLRIIKGGEIDIPIDEPAKTRKRRIKDTDEAAQKLKDAYFDGPVSGEQSSIDEALNIAKDEETNEPQKITVDFEKETKDFENEIVSRDFVNHYKYPPFELLNKTSSTDSRGVAKELETTAEHLVEILKSFGVETRVLDISRGPSVTRYELQPCAGVKISKITGLADDIALNLAAAGVRIEAPIPNKAAVGIEIPNRTSTAVGVREIIESSAFSASKSKLTVAMGKDLGGNVVIGDIGKMPHGLIAGATGSGKSVCINSIIVSLLYKARPEEVKLLMIDPKVVELGVYNGIPHLLVPVVTDPRKAAGALGWAVGEMEKRYKMFADRGVRDIDGYNRFVETLKDEPEVTKLPHVVIIIDELADLMMTAPSEVEDSINRIAAKARAAGMHLLIATQRPSVDVVTGVIKANIPTRIAFAVSSQVDSRTILDAGGAEKLLGKGDMLFSPIGSTKPKRLQGCFVSDSEVEKVVEFVKKSASAEYDDNIMVEIERQAALEKQKKTGVAEDGPGDDPMIQDAIKVVVENGQASTSLLQRKLKLGYARAARIVDEMEARGIVGPYEGSKPRKVLITKEQLMEQQATQSDEYEE